MYDYLALWDWLAFAVRWLHVVTAMAWIGASFYFIAL
ncbi:MAG: urate hydroxylase PuuD, partial [Pseudomonadota bacterium]|nr:urate hydroxylase PuuD [Pseudomonadota bacterium]